MRAIVEMIERYVLIREDNSYVILMKKRKGEVNRNDRDQSKSFLFLLVHHRGMNGKRAVDSSICLHQLFDRLESNLMQFQMIRILLIKVEHAPS